MQDGKSCVSSISLAYPLLLFIAVFNMTVEVKSMMTCDLIVELFLMLIILMQLIIELKK